MRILQTGDFHFGAPARPDLVESLEDLIARERYDVVAFCGDFAQRSRIGEFLRGRALVRHAQRVSATIAVAGNHDIAWWTSPMHLFGAEPISRKYRRWIGSELEPVLSLPGATFVGLNTSHGIAAYTLTTRLRDLAVVGAVRPAQLRRCKDLLGRTPAGDLRAIVMHHNPVRGQLSQRFGIPNHRAVLDAFAAARVDLVLCAHDHQERVEAVERDGHGVIVSVAGTISTRSRGGRPCSATVVTVERHEITLDVLLADAAGAFVPDRRYTFPRPSA
ncbi:MAG: metallophosphoesterase family protein [Gemmatimonadaceae bacterium]